MRNKLYLFLVAFMISSSLFTCSKKTSLGKDEMGKIEKDQSYAFQYFNKESIKKVIAKKKEFPNHSFSIDGSYLLKRDSIDITYFIDNFNSLEEQLIETEIYLDRLDEMLVECQQLIDEEFDNKGITFEYIEWFLEGMDDNDLKLYGILPTSNESLLIAKTKEEIQVSNVAFHPKYDDVVVVDFSVAGYSCDDYLVFKFDSNGKLLEFTVEG